mmetsp:Transcript_91308/g.158293  ORF Transcript_91308/g.158293 Transcript_91308/m.158293 type:complete len:278 (+) Transcript_91308:234-1067(+)
MQPVEDAPRHQEQEPLCQRLPLRSHDYLVHWHRQHDRQSLANRCALHEIFPNQNGHSLVHAQADPDAVLHRRFGVQIGVRHPEYSLIVPLCDSAAHCHLHAERLPAKCYCHPHLAEPQRLSLGISELDSLNRHGNCLPIAPHPVRLPQFQPVSTGHSHTHRRADSVRHDPVQPHLQWDTPIGYRQLDGHRLAASQWDSSFLVSHIHRYGHASRHLHVDQLPLHVHRPQPQRLPVSELPQLVPRHPQPLPQPLALSHAGAHPDHKSDVPEPHRIDDSL